MFYILSNTKHILENLITRIELRLKNIKIDYRHTHDGRIA